MLRGFGGRITLAATIVIGLATAPRDAAAAPDVALPPGTRPTPEGHYVAGRGLRETTDYIARELGRRGIRVEQIGPYRSRGVELTRFLSRADSTPWLAIQVLRMSGKTLIFFVPRPSA